MKIIIPARAGSKGFPNKNKLLFDFTAKQLSDDVKDVIVTTDDDEIFHKAVEYKFLAIRRDEDLCDDETSTKDVLLNTIDRCKIPEYEMIVMLYLTYPGRTRADIQKAIDFLNRNNAESLLCKIEIKHHPYLCLLEYPKHRGYQLTPHDLYRRQDYPKMFGISHYIFVSYAKEILRLNHNLYNNDTIFMPIETPVDIDTESDYERFLKENNHGN